MMNAKRKKIIDKKILEIADNLIIKLSSKEIIKSNGILDGKSGLAITTYILSEYYKDNQLKDLTCNLVKKCVSSINRGNFYHTFGSGIAGFGWCLNYLKKNGLYSEDEIAFINETDEYLYNKMVKDLKRGNFDFLHGATGICLYFMQNLTNKHIKYINTYVDLLEEISVKGKNSYKWESVIDFAKGIKGYNLGLSHGIASIISILSKILKLGINEKKAKRMLVGSINFLISNIHKDANVNNCYFPDAVYENFNKTKSRMAWCYGDLGISISLYQASLATGNENLEKLSVEILEFSTKRKDLKSEFVIDAGLCHGSSGIAQIYNRMYYNTNKDIYKNARDFWIDITLKNAKFDDGLAGYKAWFPSIHGGWRNEYCLLEGVSGICLSLLNSLSEKHIDWDECLLLS